MGNGASKKYHAVNLTDATIHSTDDIPDALVPSTSAQTWEATKHAVTLQNWIFASATSTSGDDSTPEISFEQTQRLNPEKYQFTRGTGDAKETVATIVCTHRKLGGATFTFYRTEPAYRDQKPCDDPTLTKIKEEGSTLYPYAEISVKGVTSATYCVHTSVGLKEVYKIQKMGMIKFRCVIEQSGSDGEGCAVAKAQQANAIGSKGKIEVGKGCDLMAVCSLVILLINANQQAGGGGAA